MPTKGPGGNIPVYDMMVVPLEYIERDTTTLEILNTETRPEPRELLLDEVIFQPGKIEFGFFFFPFSLLFLRAPL